MFGPISYPRPREVSGSSRIYWLGTCYVIRHLFCELSSTPHCQIPLTNHKYFCRTTSLFHALLSLVEEILDCEKHMSQYRIAVSRFNMGLEVLGEMRKLYSASTWGYLMFKQLMLNDFSNIKPSRNPGTALDVASPRGFSGFSTDVGSSWYLEGEDCLLDPMQFLADQDLFFPDVLEEGQSLGLK